MYESRLSADHGPSEHEIFSQLQIPPDTPFFVRLDGRRFQAISEKIGVEKPFDESFAKCLTAAAVAVFREFQPVLVYVAGDEINVLFLYTAPFRRRIEKIDSVLAGFASSAFSLSVLEIFGKNLAMAFDSRVVVSSSENIPEYLSLRQLEAWRNHNNAYAYWLLRKRGHKPSEAAETLKGLKTRELHEFLFCHGVNLAQTLAWQRRDILIYREPYQKYVGKQAVIRKRILKNWDLPLFSSEEGQALIQQVLEWAKPSTGG